MARKRKSLSTIDEIVQIREELKDFANQSGGKVIQNTSKKLKIYDNFISNLFYFSIIQS